jgi:ATP-dependent Clp protease ATP-binding subunit ClpA
LRRTIQRRVDSDLSQTVLDESLEPGDEVIVDAEGDRPTFEVTKEETTIGGGKVG